MKRMFLAVATILAITTSMTAYGQTTMGDIPCERWTNDREKANNSPRGFLWQDIANTRSLVAFLSGMAVKDPYLNNFDPLKKPDIESLKIWIDQFCRKNPFDSLYTGAKALYYIELTSYRNR